MDEQKNKMEARYKKGTARISLWARNHNKQPASFAKDLDHRSLFSYIALLVFEILDISTPTSQDDDRLP